MGEILKCAAAVFKIGMYPQCHQQCGLVQDKSRLLSAQTTAEPTNSPSHITLEGHLDLRSSSTNMAIIEESLQSPKKSDWKESVDHLQKQMMVYQQTSEMGDNKATEEEAQKAAEAMRRVGDSHTNPNVRREWCERAEAFQRGNKNERSSMFGDIGKGLLIILATPIALAGAAIFGTGAILYGTGSLIKGLGDLMTAGFVGRMAKRQKK